MFIGHRGGETQILVALHQEQRPVDGMAIHDLALLVVQLARLGEDLNRNPHLADVVQQAGDADRTHVLRPEPERLGQRHRQHRDIERVRRRVLVELLQLQQRQHHRAVGGHRHRQRAHHRFRLEQRHRAVRLDLVQQPPERLRFLAKHQVERRRSFGPRRRIVDAVHIDAAKADAERSHLSRLAGIDRAVRQPQQHFLQEAFELIARHAPLQLDALNAGVHESRTPVPRPQTAKALAAEHHFVLEKRDRTRNRETLERFIRGIDRTLARGMSRGVEGGEAEYVRERVQKADRIVHVAA